MFYPVPMYSADTVYDKVCSSVTPIKRAVSLNVIVVISTLNIDEMSSQEMNYLLHLLPLNWNLVSKEMTLFYCCTYNVCNKQ